MIKRITINTCGQQLIEVTHKVQDLVANCEQEEGLATIFIRHTSASLLIQENADPSVQTDLIRWFNRLIPEKDPLYTHTAEGPDDMPAHIKSALTQVSVAIPYENRQLLLGIWQGLYLFEHRHHRQQRQVLVHIA